MVLESLGVSRSEHELRELCDCTIFGTTAIQLIQAARALGFTGSRKYSLTLEDLRDLTEQGYFPIVYVVTGADGPSADVHSLVVVSVAEGEVSVLDPQEGPRVISVTAFGEMWAVMKNLTVVVAKSFEPRPVE
jgi:ABC-type bacteriocin/lantibiotic exporter with double-glycine peptidase domain